MITSRHAQPRQAQSTRTRGTRPSNRPKHRCPGARTGAHAQPREGGWADPAESPTGRGEFPALRPLERLTGASFPRACAPSASPLPRAPATGAIIFSAILQAEESGIGNRVRWMRPGRRRVLTGLQGPRWTSPPGARAHQGAGGTLPGPRAYREPFSGLGRPGGEQALRGPLGPLAATVPLEGQRHPCSRCYCSPTPAVRNRILGRKTVVSSFCIKR